MLLCVFNSVCGYYWIYSSTTKYTSHTLCCYQNLWTWVFVFSKYCISSLITWRALWKKKNQTSSWLDVRITFYTKCWIWACFWKGSTGLLYNVQCTCSRYNLLQCLTDWNGGVAVCESLELNRDLSCLSKLLTAWIELSYIPGVTGTVTVGWHGGQYRGGVSACVTYCNWLVENVLLWRGKETPFERWCWTWTSPILFHFSK